MSISDTFCTSHHTILSLYFILSWGKCRNCNGHEKNDDVVNARGRIPVYKKLLLRKRNAGCGYKQN